MAVVGTVKAEDIQMVGDMAMVEGKVMVVGM